MVHIELPIHITAGAMDSSLERLGIELKYTETPVHLQVNMDELVPFFQACFQYKKGMHQDTVNVDIHYREQLLEVLAIIFETLSFRTDMSVEQPFLDHLSEALGAELSKQLGLSAISSNVSISASPDLYQGIASSLLETFESSPLLRQFLFEQYLQQSPDRFFPGNNETYEPIPFAVGDTVSFFLTLNFQNSIINGGGGFSLLQFMDAADLPVVKFIVKFYFAS
jgi:hypothetical protein